MVFQARDHTCSMSSVWKTTSSQDIGTFYDAIKVAEGVLTVRFTYRDSKIRIIGAGYWRKGKKIYEKENGIY